MTKPTHEFGDLLTQSLKSIAARECRTMGALKDELGYERANRIIERLGLAQPSCPEDAEWMQLYDQQA